MGQTRRLRLRKVKCLVRPKETGNGTFPMLLLGRHSVFQEHTHNSLGLLMPRRLQALGTGQENRAGRAEPWISVNWQPDPIKMPGLFWVAGGKQGVGEGSL